MSSFCPFRIIHPNSRNSLIIVCEHASNFIPEKYDSLGLDEELLKKHIAWDPGAEGVALALSKIFEAKLFLGTVSRLVYDCNRPPEAPDSTPHISEIYEIPGNRNLSTEQKSERAREIYFPFHERLSEEIRKMETTPTVVTIHSFNPVYKGEKREMELGVLHDRDSRLADILLDSLPIEFNHWEIRRNEPYGPQNKYVMHTLVHHTEKQNLPGVMLEIRNDLIDTEEKQKNVAETLAKTLRSAMAKIPPNHLL